VEFLFASEESATAWDTAALFFIMTAYQFDKKQGENPCAA
jgi:hypothetical protein